jgi:16S rRNA (uracil1498-N3)-methyltransferase
MSMSDEYFKLPRLYTTSDLNAGHKIELTKEQSHYLGNVLRRSLSDRVRLFNGRDGEWLGEISELSKKHGTVSLIEHLLPQPENLRCIHLIFTPIKKHRMDWLIEKAVELGVTDFHPVLTQNTEARKIKEERLEQQIFEAAEQCERLSIPTLHGLSKLEKFLEKGLGSTQILACLERFETVPLKDLNIDQTDNIAFLIGPEGGFTKDEKEYIAKNSTPVGLGDTILRCETAVVKALCLINP